MSWIEDHRGYDRSRQLSAARRAAARGNHEKAITLYSRVRRIEPENTDLLRRIAAQRARAGHRDEAWRDCREAVKRLKRGGFIEQAIGVCCDFATYLPKSVDVWVTLAELEHSRDRALDAIDRLIEGRGKFRRRAERAEALLLLRIARRIDRTHFGANYDLARLLVRCGARVQARRVLEELESQATGSNLRRLRGRLLLLSPGPRIAGRWFLACVGRG